MEHIQTCHQRNPNSLGYVLTSRYLKKNHNQCEPFHSPARLKMDLKRAILPHHWRDGPIVQRKRHRTHQEGHSEGPVHNEPNYHDYEFLYGPQDVFMDETAETHYLVCTKSSSAALKEDHRSEEGVKYSPATRELAARLKRRKADVLRELSETSSIR